jgi:hypothetical protein
MIEIISSAIVVVVVVVVVVVDFLCVPAVETAGYVFPFICVYSI